MRLNANLHFMSVFAQPSSIDRRKAWYGIDYIRALCAQAGYRFHENPAEMDENSLDGQIFFRSTLSVFVQVKCTSTSLVRQKTYPIKDAWRKNWKTLDLPGYFVVVSVPSDTDDWLEHADNPRSTLHRSAAFWTRIDPLPDGVGGITVRSSQRLTVDTFATWAQDLQEATKAYGGGTP